MPEIRKLIRLTPRCFAITIPAKYARALAFKFGDYVEISMSDLLELTVRRHEAPKKQ